MYNINDDLHYLKFEKFLLYIFESIIVLFKILWFLSDIRNFYLYYSNFYVYSLKPLFLMNSYTYFFNKFNMFSSSIKYFSENDFYSQLFKFKNLISSSVSFTRIFCPSLISFITFATPKSAGNEIHVRFRSMSHQSTHKPFLSLFPIPSKSLMVIVLASYSRIPSFFIRASSRLRDVLCIPSLSANSLLEMPSTITSAPCRRYSSSKKSMIFFLMLLGEIVLILSVRTRVLSEITLRSPAMKPIFVFPSSRTRSFCIRMTRVLVSETTVMG